MKLSRPVIYSLLAMVVLILGLNWPVMATGVKSIAPDLDGRSSHRNGSGIDGGGGPGEEDPRCASAP